MDVDFPEGMMADIEKFMTEVHSGLPIGEDIYHAVFATKHFFPLQRQAELKEMMAHARKSYPKTVMEIGADKGGGLYHWCQGLPSLERVIACEIRGLPYAQLFERAFPHIQFLWLPVSSYRTDTIETVHRWLCGQPIDILFIDGDKAKFEADFFGYLPYMSAVGTIFMHDITDTPGPGDAFRNIKKLGYRCRAIANTTDSLSAMSRENEGIPSSGPHEDWLRYWKGKSCGVGVIDPVRG